ncbi:MAG: hypothetical protein J2P21_26685 [Chloracidobacterium sp.]|nr:hypothetical protein [Chloracidobacterium sp.]
MIRMVDLQTNTISARAKSSPTTDEPSELMTTTPSLVRCLRIATLIVPSDRIADGDGRRNQRQYHRSASFLSPKGRLESRPQAAALASSRSIVFAARHPKGDYKRSSSIPVVALRHVELLGIFRTDENSRAEPAALIH